MFCHVLTLLILLLNSSIVNATDAYPKTNDQSTTIAVPRWWYNGQTADQITQSINANNARITHLRVEDPTVPTFAVTMVQNTGDYSSTWWWYVSQTADQVTTNLDGRRLISIDPYMTSSGLEFAVVMVPNTGDQDRAWWWYYDVDEDSVNSLLTQNNARPVEVRPYDNGGRKYAVIIRCGRKELGVASGCDAGPNNCQNSNRIETDLVGARSNQFRNFRGDFD